MTKNSQKINAKIFYENKQIINTYSIKFIALFVDSSLSWNKNIAQFMSTLTTACYMICSVKPFVNQETLSKFNFSYVHSNFMVQFVLAIHTIVIVSSR